MKENRGVKREKKQHGMMMGKKSQLLQNAIFKSVRNENDAY